MREKGGPERISKKEGNTREVISERRGPVTGLDGSLGFNHHQVVTLWLLQLLLTVWDLGV